MTTDKIEFLTVDDAAAWHRWLAANGKISDGVWLVLAKKGTLKPTTLTYAQALEEALCSGWIDGQKRSVDAHTFCQRFTPRRKASMWSERNIGLTANLIAEGRMLPSGQAEIDRAKADGRWDRAYAGQATAEVPEDLAAAIAASPAAALQFSTLSRAGRYTLIHPVITAASAVSRANRVAKIVIALERDARN
jgi:uncharacterized protein YdeI (YjbR/CyaY-like superfamily)